MYEIVKHIDFCFGHRLIDYQGKCNQPHGHNGRAEIRLASDTLDEMGMVADFRDVRSSIQAWIDEHLDHRMILRRDDPLAEAIQALGQHAYLIDDNPTTENLARLVFEQTQALGFPVIAVTPLGNPRLLRHVRAEPGARQQRPASSPEGGHQKRLAAPPGDNQNLG